MRRAFADAYHDRAFPVLGAVDHDRLTDAKAFTHCRFEVTECARGRDDCRADDVFPLGSLQHSREAHPGFRGAGSGVRRPVRRLRHQEELFPSCVYYGRTERTRDRWGVSLARYRDEAVARSEAATKILPSC